MKKKFYAILLTAVFLVGIMAVAAFAADTYDISFESDTSDGGLTISSYATSMKKLPNSSVSGTVKLWLKKNGTAAEGGVVPAVTVTADEDSSASALTCSWSGLTSGAYTEEVGSTAAGTTTDVILTITASAAGTYTITPKVTGYTSQEDVTGTATPITVTVTDAPKPAWVTGSTADGTNLSDEYNETDKTLYSEQVFADTNELAKFIVKTENTFSTFKLNSTFNPTTSGLTLTVADDTDSKTKTAYITGTVATLSKTTEYTLTVTPEDEAGSGETRTYKFKVTPGTVIKASTKPGAITWGQEFSFTPALSTGSVKTNGWAILDATPNNDETHVVGDNHLTSAMLTANGFTFDQATGAITGTWAPTNASTDVVNFATDDTWTGADITTKKIWLKATNGKNGSDTKNSIGYQEFTLTFKGVAPTITKTASEVTSAFNALNTNNGALYNTALPATDGAIKVTATGPGKIEWTVEPPTGKLSDYGLEATTVAQATVTETGENAVFTPATLTITGTPKTTVKNLKLTITAKNGKGKSTTIQPTLTIGGEAINIYESDAMAEDESPLTDDTLASATTLTGNKIVGSSTFATKDLYARPGPVKWTATNLPAGITLTVDTKDSTHATLKGSYTAARKDDEDETKQYSIKVVNTNFTGLEKTLEGSVMVWAKPEITTATLFKKNVIETDTAYDFEITASNTPQKAKWSITAGGTALLTNGAIPTPVANAVYQPDPGVTGFTPNYSIKVDDEKLGETDYKVVLTGSLDCVPKSGAAIKFVVTAGNEAGTTTKEFEVTVKGKAPALKKEDITLSDSATGKDIKVTAGNGPITMKAYVDSKTAKKLFGVDDEIDLMTANVTGLLFANDTTYKGASSIKYDSTEATSTTGSVPARYTSGMAYSKLPVTVEASNSDISSKTASAKYTITKAASAKPSWTSVHNLSATYKGKDLAANDTLGSSHELLITAGTALPAASSETPDSEGILFKAAGDGPWEITVKPETKNGLTATYTESAGTVGITGTVEAGKKDVTTKFTITVKNPSTGDSAKSDITIVAKPKPTVDDTDIEATVLYGKKVKLTPKVTASSNGMKWLIRSITSATGNYEATTDNTDAKAELKELHGLDFDENKGAISGTPNHATGKDNPITITMVASSDITTSELVTAKIAVLGEKAKLTTKKVTVAIDGSDLSDKVIETNLAGYEATRANVTFEGNFSNVDAVKNMSLATGSETNTAVFGSESPSAVTKKASVTVMMTNFDTVTTGKLTITVDGATPEVGEVNAISVTAGSNTTESVTLSNPTQVSQKIKWKVATKPNVSGVSAKIKGDASGATITVKANKKVADGTTATFTITATDSVSKKTSEAKEVTVEISNPNDTEAAPLEAKDVAATPEAKTEAEKSDEKILGEGEVHMGAERTADKLTAQQRKFFEDEGYVIAAVLPEIEVTAAGQYDFEVDLDKEVETGAELVWFAFASKPTTDDEIVDFADEKGKETKVVPESHVVTVAPWLNAETKYAPVIAVKAAAKDADATTVEGVKEAAEAKTEE